MDGQTIGSWQLRSEIGEGGMGKVYLAHHTKLGTPAAVKILSKVLTHDDTFRERFAQEARTQAQLRHPHIAQVFDYFELDQTWFLVIEYLKGGTLATAIEKARGPLPVDRALTWSRHALQALDMAHQKGIIHRDVKSTNILLDEYDRAKVTDFGIAKVVGGRRLTTAGLALGTPEYMSPEQIRNPSKIDHRSDVYSMGVVLYELLSGQVPFESDSTSDFEIRQAQVTQEPPPLRTHNAGIPEPLEEDSYLLIYSPSRKLYRDDDGGKGTDAKLVINADEAGEWEVIVSSLVAKRTGDYTLTLREL